MVSAEKKATRWPTDPSAAKYQWCLGFCQGELGTSDDLGGCAGGRGKCPNSAPSTAGPRHWEGNAIERAGAEPELGRKGCFHQGSCPKPTSTTPWILGGKTSCFVAPNSTKLHKSVVAPDCTKLHQFVVRNSRPLRRVASTGGIQICPGGYQENKRGEPDLLGEETWRIGATRRIKARKRPPEHHWGEGWERGSAPGASRFIAGLVTCHWGWH